MKNKASWQPTKFIITKSGLKASRNLEYVPIGSRLVTDLAAKLFEKAIKSHGTGRLLDLGCGKVPLYNLYRDQITDNICVDWPNSLHLNNHLDYEMDLNYPLDFPNNQFDTILLTSVLEHIKNPDVLWHEMTRILNSNGKMILSTPFLYNIHEPPYDYYRFTEFILRDFCKRNKLNLISLESYGGAVEVILVILAKQIAFSKILSTIHRFICKIYINSKIGKFFFLRTSKSYPLGYVLVAQKSSKI